MAELEKRAAVCGISLAVHRNSGTEEEMEEVKALDLGAVLENYAASESGMPAMPDDVLAWLQQQDAALSAAADHLNADPLPVPDRTVSDYNAPIMNLLGAMHLGKALTAHALWQAELGDDVALHRARYAYRLSNRWYAPGAHSQLIGIA